MIAIQFEASHTPVKENTGNNCLVPPLALNGHRWKSIGALCEKGLHLQLGHHEISFVSIHSYAHTLYADIHKVYAYILYADIHKVYAYILYADIPKLYACILYAEIPKLYACILYVDIQTLYACIHFVNKY
jgi:hypothetical protein